ncbi:seipin-like [Liolophura sinensis]|uniref:seipin-like n=1 Tax=Liolophura sinensis TaxID=3198878 RepID=UPI0031598281
MQTEIVFRTQRTPFVNMILMIIRSGIFWVQDSFKWTLNLMKYMVLRGAILLFAVLCLLWLSVFLYASFYYTYMPAESHVKPVHFSFRVCENGEGLCSFPSANVSLVKDNKDEILAKGQVYRIMLELDLPESPTNQYLGMFMVSVQMYDKNREILQTSSRAAILRYRSALLETMNTFVFSPMFLSGLTEQKQILPIELFPQYVDNPYKPSVGALIEIQNQKIQFYSASLRIYANFTGLRYLMFNWPVSCAVFGIGTNMFFLSAIALLSWYHFFCSDTSKLDFGERLEFRENMSLEERRKKIRAVLEKEKREQEKLPIPSKVGKAGSSRSDLGHPSRTRQSAETLGAESSSGGSGETTVSKGIVLEDEETVILSDKGDSNEPSGDTSLRHRHHQNDQ